VAVMMVLVKVSRMACGAPNMDDYEDLIGYGALAAALAQKDDSKINPTTSRQT
jgi:hypothetical protein